MPTKLSRYCDGILEAGWLISIIGVPLFFNVYSSRIFEPDKLTLLRSIVLVMLAAWAVKLIVEGGLRWENVQLEGKFPQSLLRIPLALPVLALVVVYLLSTIFSISPRVSLMGSYQRLQGTYTTFSYLVVFAALAANLRRRVQIDRFINTVVLVSLPISLYGILQRYRIDPVPWAGDVVNRVASNMGNAIFVAAYLIMANPFTMIRIFEAFNAILKERDGLWKHILRATLYVFIASLQLIALYLSGSRGPWLGWMAGSFFLFVLLALYWRKRALVLGVIFAAGLLAVFLLLINIPNGPLQPLRDNPYLGRLGHLAEAESDTGRVRVLIWQGASYLVLPHEPLEFPDGSKDAFNFLRPLIGYGPETMYVAYNRYYPPELGQLEKRNASPDRSHNETWDSLVITGVLGLGVYLLLIASIFYYGLRWLGLINSPAQRNLFLVFYIVGGAAGVVGMILWRGRAFFGVGLPFGIILGLIGYLTLVALQDLSKKEMFTPVSTKILPLYVIAPLAAIAAHFVETNFGIAIAATRTYFWSFAGLMLVAGYVWPRLEKDAPLPEAAPVGDAATEASSRKKARRIERARRPAEARGFFSPQTAWVRNGLVGGVIAMIVFHTLGYEFISNTDRQAAVSAILVNSLTRLANRGGATSFGVLALILTTLFAAAILLTTAGASAGRSGGSQDSFKDWLKAVGLALGVTFLGSLIFWTLHATNLYILGQSSPSNLTELKAQIDRITGLVIGYDSVLVLLGLILAVLLPEEWPVNTRREDAWSFIFAGVALVIALVAALLSNIVSIQANMAFKMGEPLSGDQWPVATVIFQQTIAMQPQEDFYYLYLGRSYLEQAKLNKEAAQQDALVQEAEKTLKQAQSINPLNTDHTANLARLYSWWSTRSGDANVNRTRGDSSNLYYGQAVKLSPNNATLWTEWATLLIGLDRMSDAYEKITHALNLDPTFGTAHVLMGDYYLRLAQTPAEEWPPEVAASLTYTDTLEKAAVEYGLAGDAKGDAAARVGYYMTQANVYIQIGQASVAIEALEKAVKLKPKTDSVWRIEELSTRAYLQLGDKEAALQHLESMKKNVPTDQASRVTSLMNQINLLP